MLFSLRFNRPLIVNPVLNEYIKNSNYEYIKNIIKNVEYKNKKKMILGDFNSEPLQIKQDSLVIPSVFFLSLTTIIYFFIQREVNYCFLLQLYK